jgi:uncharacterized protein (DUF433 family)
MVALIARGAHVRAEAVVRALTGLEVLPRTYVAVQVEAELAGVTGMPPLAPRAPRQAPPKPCAACAAKDAELARLSARVAELEAAQAAKPPSPARPSRDPKYHGRIESRPGVRGGEPCIAGTRIPVATIQSCHAGGWDAERICEEYPTLVAADVEAALAYREPPPAPRLAAVLPERHCVVTVVMPPEPLATGT